jgi:hypothetical protein
MNESRRRQKRFRREHRHHAAPADVLMTRNGKRMAIIRPLDPDLALRLVNEIPNGTPHEEAEKRFNAVLDAQPYKFIGMATKPQPGDLGPPYILHPQTGKRIDRVQPGDSFVDYDAMQQHAERIPDPTEPPHCSGNGSV